ncbi:SDR family NAD(P)-dependent oxidoreductase [Pseudorhodoferax sp.]|uniref:SDR family NAD(P)-dependent oxidoreductase n=1 Tax=Pseudorhodoferax sp. TaxID=1993553 RepID=UPI002DD6471E|nr:SDR family NAD(P)-dependent oxidoreductase [Pseudorhodoferax sp.]
MSNLFPNTSAIVTGGASGLGLAAVRELVRREVHVVILDLPTSPGAEVCAELGPLARFAPGTVTSEADVQQAIATAAAVAPLRWLVHCAGRGAPIRLVEKDGSPGSLEKFTEVTNLNVIGTFNVLRLAAAQMAKNEIHGDSGQRGACVLTASVAAFEGQIGQIAYSAGKAAIVGMTLVSARDLAKHGVRVNTIAPGLFDTPALVRLSDQVKAGLAASIPFPSRLGRPAEFARLAAHLLENDMMNGETVRLDGAIRMQPR